MENYNSEENKNNGCVEALIFFFIAAVIFIISIFPIYMLIDYLNPNPFKNDPLDDSQGFFFTIENLSKTVLINIVSTLLFLAMIYGQLFPSKNNRVKKSDIYDEDILDTDL